MKIRTILSFAFMVLLVKIIRASLIENMEDEQAPLVREFRAANQDHRQSRAFDCCDGGMCKEYRGTKSTTIHGLTCLPWDSSKSHKWNPDNYQELKGNYCRNPSNSENGLWCYVDHEDRYQECKDPCGSKKEGRRRQRGNEAMICIHTCPKKADWVCAGPKEGKARPLLNYCMLDCYSKYYGYRYIGKGKCHGPLGDLKFVKFFVTWCPYCQAIAPTWELLKSKFAGKVKFAEVDCEKKKSECKKYNITSYPRLILFKDGKLLQTAAGRDIDTLSNFLQESLKWQTHETFTDG